MDDGTEKYTNDGGEADPAIKETVMTSRRNTPLPRDKLFEKKGILDPTGEALNPLTNKQYENMYVESDKRSYIDYANLWTDTPMYAKHKEIIETIYDNQVVLIISGTGSGKTVLTPKFALHVLNYCLLYTSDAADE